MNFSVTAVLGCLVSGVVTGNSEGRRKLNNNRSLWVLCSDCTSSRDDFVSITLYISMRRGREGALISCVGWVETKVITFQSACLEQGRA